LAGCSPTAETPTDEQRNAHYQAGRERLSALDYKGAIECFERALEDNPRSSLAHYELGVLFDQHENDYPAALYHYNKALKIRRSGYPADNIRQRIPACLQELIKADSLAVLNPTVLRETEHLRVENEVLRKQVETLQAYIANRPMGNGAAPPGVRSAVPGLHASPTNAAAAASPRFSPASASATASIATAASGSAAERERAALATAPGARTRTHAVKAGETPAAIARQYQIRLPALLAANPGVEPKRLRVGQVLNVPLPAP
jgi:hypothetical protein